MEFKIIERSTSSKLNKSIRERLDDGWIIAEMPRCTAKSEYTEVWYCSMTKEVKSTTTIKD